MALRVRRRGKRRQNQAHPLIRAGDRTMTFVTDRGGGELDGIELPSMEEIEAALDTVPEELDWDWASGRLFPLFERGYGEGVTGDPMVNTVSHLGVGIGYGIDFGPVIGRVTRSMARRWEASVQQIEQAAFTHLAEVVAGIGAIDLQPTVHRGHFFRGLGKPDGWASSVILAGEAELVRIFGSRDVLFTVPARNSLLAFGPATPTRAVVEVTLQLESMDPHPLQLDPFVMEDGILRWEGLEDDEPIGVV
ncbi:MAG TPA: hypothetical protein VM253_02255 [Candidatus Limnocylindrales bacterium]|jgi:hypothetical protein|nr:hypothetical protein [Candidatus Limnocylindrales bacterium]